MTEQNLILTIKTLSLLLIIWFNIKPVLKEIFKGKDLSLDKITLVDFIKFILVLSPIALTVFISGFGYFIWIPALFVSQIFRHFFAKPQNTSWFKIQLTIAITIFATVVMVMVYFFDWYLIFHPPLP